jgi:hypothetical protein
MTKHKKLLFWMKIDCLLAEVASNLVKFLIQHLSTPAGSHTLVNCEVAFGRLREATVG